MSRQNKWIDRRIRLGWIFLAAGILVTLLGILLLKLADDLSFSEKIITGLGIVLLGVGTSQLIRYGAARRGSQPALNSIVEERDERTQLIQARAGNRAYMVSTALTIGGLMWVSLAENGVLPPLSGDVLWYFLAVLVIIPIVVYTVSVASDQKYI
jgi:multisubunit Na+/H+ antiporter MnhG subunit